MRSRPDEHEPDMLVWFFACLMLSGAVSAAFLFLGDISRQPEVRMVYMEPASKAKAASEMAAGCGERAARPCLPDSFDGKLLMARR